MTSTIPRKTVDSSSLASVGYSAEDSVLEAEFRHGAVYRFFLVPEPIYRGLLEAESKGQYFNTCVRGRFPHEKR